MDDSSRLGRASLVAPPEVVTMARAVLGSIDLDPCSNPSGNRMIMAAQYFDRDTLSVDDLIAKPWESTSGKRCFLGLSLIHI